MGKLRIGIIGCNYMGRMHAECYRKMENVDIVAVADINEKTAREVAEPTNSYVYTNGIEMIERCELDAIDICLPTFLHAEHALAAMDKVKYIFIEKPVCLTIKECKALLRKQKETGVQVQVGHVIRFWEEYCYLKKVYDEGHYGKLINLNLRRLSPSPSWGKNAWQQNNRLSGGALMDLHIHDVDFMLYMLGEPKSARCLKNLSGEKHSYACTLCEYEQTLVNIEGTWNLPNSYPFEMYYRAVFEKAVVEFEHNKLTVFDSEGRQEITVEKLHDGKTDFKGANVSSQSGYMNELIYFADRAQKGEKIEKCTLFEATKTLEFVIERLQK